MESYQLLITYQLAISIIMSARPPTMLDIPGIDDQSFCMGTPERRNGVQGGSACPPCYDHGFCVRLHVPTWALLHVPLVNSPLIGLSASHCVSRLPTINATCVHLGWLTQTVAVSAYPEGRERGPWPM